MKIDIYSRELVIFSRCRLASLGDACESMSEKERKVNCKSIFKNQINSINSHKNLRTLGFGGILDLELLNENYEMFF